MGFEMPGASNVTVQQETVIESLAGLNVSVDREKGVIRGVKLIGFESKNRRYYPPEVLRAAVTKYEGAKVNVDHPPVNDPSRPRGVADRIGVIKAARFVEGSGIHGDFHFNPKHALAEQIAWDAEHNPSAIGFSHNSLVTMGKRDKGRSYVAEVNDVKSVDLVADPATTNGVFESQGFDQEDNSMDLSKLTLEQIKSSRPDLVKALENEQAGDAELQKAQADLKAAQQKIAELEKQQAEAKVEAEVVKQLESAGFDPSNKHADKRRHVSEAFKKVLIACESEQSRKELIDDRKQVVGEWTLPSGGKTSGGVQKPVTTPATEGAQDLSADDWKKRILTRR